MKKNLEHSIKESLENFEMPYNANAWEALESKLDAKMPVTKKPNYKLYLTAAAVTTAIVVSYFYFTGGNIEPSSSNTNQLTTQNISTSTEDVNTENEATVSNEISISNETAANNNVSDNESNNTITVVNTNQTTNNTTTNEVINNERGTNPIIVDINGGIQIAPKPEIHQVETNELNTTVSLVLPELNEVCAGTTIEINNENDIALRLTGPDVQEIIPAKASKSVRIKTFGAHIIEAEDKALSDDETTFMAKDVPAVDFTIDQITKFERGLPTTKVSSNVPGVEFKWVFNNATAHGEAVDAHFYKKGEHDVTLIVTGSNGCTNALTKKVYVENNYNLMAVNSFRPNSTDPAVNKFMPFALTQREVDFTMIIIDPKDGHIVYQTNDASLGWDGVDAKTGRLVPFETSYIWKVTIQQLATNEDRNEYTGQIIPVPSTK